MKVHAAAFLPPPPTTAAPSPAAKDLASSKAGVAFEQSLGANPDSSLSAQAGQRGRTGRGDAASRRAAAPPPAPARPGPAALADAPSVPGAEAPYAPGRIVNIEA